MLKNAALQMKKENESQQKVKFCISIRYTTVYIKVICVCARFRPLVVRKARLSFRDLQLR